MEPKGIIHSKQSVLERCQKNRLKRQSELRKENEFYDLILKSEDGLEIKVHKFILSSASNYFKDLLTTPMKEKYEKSILMPGITADVLEKIITFIYTNEFEEKIEDVERIIKYAVIYQLEELVEICSLTLIKSINDHTCVNYWQLARVNLIYGLEDKCLTYIIGKADYLFKNSFLKNVTINEMKTLLAKDSLHSKYPEQTIFEYVWTWAENQVTSTKIFSEVFSEVVDLFKFSELKNEYVYSRIFGNDNLLDNTELLKKVARLTNVKQHNLMPQVKEKNQTPTRFVFAKRKFIGLASNKMFTEVEQGSRTVQIDKILPRSFSYTKFGTNFFLICGGMQSSKCEYLDPSTQEWKEFPSMKNERSSHACAYFDNKIYACGGTESKSIEIFDLGKGEWCTGPQMISKGVDFGLTEVNGVLYAFKAANNVEIFDPRVHIWSTTNCQVNQYNSSIYHPHLQQHSYTQCFGNSSYIYCFNKGIKHKFDTRSNRFIEKVTYMNFDSVFSVCDLGNYFYGFGYKKLSIDNYTLNFNQNEVNGSLIYTNIVKIDYIKDFNKTALVALYY